MSGAGDGAVAILGQDEGLLVLMAVPLYHCSKSG
jgi:hypothetical protein